MKTISKFLLLFLVTIFARAIYAGPLGPGKYYGIVVFDRWDGCILYRGIYVMYISENVKDQLRKYAGQLIEVYAADVFQPVNPGDGLIKEVEYLGRPAETKENFSLDGLEVSTFPAFRDGKKPTVAIQIMNTGIKDCQVLPEELAPTLLTKQPAELRPLSPSDGPSIALMTRSSIQNIAKYGGKGSGVAQGYHTHGASLETRLCRASSC